MDYTDKFKTVLYEDEKVIASASASKKSFILRQILAPAIIFLVATLALTIVAIVCPRRFVPSDGSFWSRDHYAGMPLWVLFLVSGVLLAIFGLVFFLSYKSANNYYIALTEKRIIIRRGALTTDFSYLAIDKVSGNIQITCNQSIFDRNENNCALYISIELLPVGHRGISIATPPIVDGYNFSMAIDKQVKENAKLQTIQTIKE